VIGGRRTVGYHNCRGDCTCGEEPAPDPREEVPEPCGEVQPQPRVDENGAPWCVRDCPCVIDVGIRDSKSGSAG